MIAQRSLFAHCARVLAACALAGACDSSEAPGELDPPPRRTADAAVIRDAAIRDAAREGQHAADAAQHDSGATCAQRIARPLLAACAASTAFEDVVDTAHLPAMGFKLKGKVVERGSGAPPDRCFFQYERTLGRGVLSDSPELETARWLRVDNGASRSAVIAVIAPDFEWPAQMDDAVSLVYERAGDPFVPQRGRLELRAEDGSLLVWLGFAGTVELLPAPAELQLSRGAEVCRNSSKCAPLWAQYDLAVQLQAAPEASALAYGRQALLGGWLVTHGGVDLEITGSPCPDAFVASAAAAAQLAF